jgi:hypothetical protein
MNGTASVMGQNLLLSQKMIIPSSYLQSIAAGPMVVQKQLMKNGTFSQSQQGQEVPLKDDDKEKMEEDGAFFTEAYMLKQKGYVFTVKSIEQVDGKDANVIEIKSPKGRLFTNYYDVVSGLLVKNLVTQETPQGKAVVTTFTSNYKTFNDVKIATKIVIDYGQYKIDVTMNDIKVNQGLKAEDIK